MNKLIQKPAKGKPEKPQKPRTDFPLFPHATGYWAKKIRGRTHYFGHWDDPKGALKKYLREKEDLHAGRAPSQQNGGETVKDLCNSFLTSKQHLVETGELTERTFCDYHSVCTRIIKKFGRLRPITSISPRDFQSLRKSLAKTRGPVALGNEIQRVRGVFKYAYDAALVERPIRYGPNFKRPSKKVLRKARQAKGLRMFEADQLRKMIEASGIQLRAMIMLGINCGFGNSDVAHLPIKSLDLKKGWVEFPRPKTAIERRIPLWPETIDALKAALDTRPKEKNKSDKGLVLITKYGRAWSSQTSDNPISKETAKLLKSLKIHRPGLNFYALRHTFETIGGETKDQVAVDAIMGHAPRENDMASIYRERISDERLIAVTDFVRKWLFKTEM